MYRIQLGGNDYIKDKEIGLHYQIHRGIGVHQTKANKKGLPLKVSIFIGGPPAHSLRFYQIRREEYLHLYLLSCMKFGLLHIL